MCEELQAVVIAACKTHEETNRLKYRYRACVFVGADYFVKYGAAQDLEPELAIQEYFYQHAQQPQTPEPPRIAKIIHHFIHQHTMYLVMERIELQVSPPDLAKRIQGAVEWLANVPPPPNSTLGPVGGGVIRHSFFKDREAPFEFSDTAMLDLYIKRRPPPLTCHLGQAHRVLSKAGQKKYPPISVNGERLMFTQADMHDSNFGVDENGRTVLMDFREVGLLPESFVAFTLPPVIAASLGLSGNSKLTSMAAIAHCLLMVADPDFGTSPCA
ncbi:hypothetical protein PISMIDRAFT_104192 [Pisolithus microcarpus 441]|uniref:Aminoglycoside phosphotransferase domain-containing protein n=1 Tax=Pisolithus microcarpus 441 TaxID=765257 RepID=A0A0C9ZNN1_9AGAM|nr:hypothetical protein BKA83DRAFT_104192 [Pisolithus microcarpus]KIK21398.1 hypothetical protein PISMIDRAFT_104192 [Pisolithus microcarpus 441]